MSSRHSRQTFMDILHTMYHEVSTCLSITLKRPKKIQSKATLNYKNYLCINFFQYLMDTPGATQSALSHCRIQVSTGYWCENGSDSQRVARGVAFISPFRQRAQQVYTDFTKPIIPNKMISNAGGS